MKDTGRLPLQFDATRLQEELAYCQESWTSHFNTSYYSGDWSGIPLRSAEGAHHRLSAGTAGSREFADEPVLQHLPYTQSVIDSIQAPKTVVRYLRLAPGSVIKPHKDYDLTFWDGFVRLHIPIITNEQVCFLLDNKQVIMQEGECWFADFSKEHSVANNGKTDRVHLVIDCLVNEWLKNLFVTAGIIGEDEQPPQEMDQYDRATKLLIIEQLEVQGSAKSLELAAQMRKEMGVTCSAS